MDFDGNVKGVIIIFFFNINGEHQIWKFSFFIHISNYFSKNEIQMKNRFSDFHLTNLNHFQSPSIHIGVFAVGIQFLFFARIF